ncbi:MAG TPA: hypothetical protein VIL71_17370 [Spirillospora sp.]
MSPGFVGNAGITYRGFASAGHGDADDHDAVIGGPDRTPHQANDNTAQGERLGERWTIQRRAISTLNLPTLNSSTLHRRQIHP